MVGQRQKDELLERKVAEFEVTNAPTSLVLERLAKESEIPIGIEAAPEKQHDNTTIVVGLRNGTVRDILNAVIRADPRYHWTKVDSVINVFPKENKDPLLETKIALFEVRNLNRAQAIRVLVNSAQVKERLRQTGVRERTAIVLPGDSELGLPTFSLSLKNSTVRDALNGIMQASKSQHWIYFRYGAKTEYFSLNMR